MHSHFCRSLCLPFLYAVAIFVASCGRPHSQTSRHHSLASGLAKEPIFKLDSGSLSINAARLPERSRSSVPQGSSEGGTLNFNVANLPSGEVEVSVESKCPTYVSTDGGVPRVADDGAPLPGTLRYTEPLRIAEASIVRAVCRAQDGSLSPIRSQAILPRLWDVRLARLPSGLKPIKGIYVTGPFRNWSPAFDEAFRLAPHSDGSFFRTLTIDRSQNVDFKFVVRFEDESLQWIIDESLPQSGTAPYINNVLPSGRSLLARRYVAARDGMLEEAGLNLAIEPVGAIDAGPELVRIKVGFLNGDIESVRVRFAQGNSFALAKGETYPSEGSLFAAYSGLVHLPEREIDTSFVFEVSDAGRSLFVGPKGILTGDPFAHANAAFRFQYNPSTQQLNGKDIYQIPLWAVDAIWYQIFPERFRNGDTSNDIAGDFPPEFAKARPQLDAINRTVLPWTASWFTFQPEERKVEEIVRRTYPALDPREIQREIVFARRYGGDLAGIRASLPYLKTLGINAVYLNPVFDSDSLHRYDTKDYRHIDPDLGPMSTDARGNKVISAADQALLASEKVDDPTTWKYTSADREFISLVNEIHAQGMRVVIDGVFNHSAANGPIVADVALRGKESPFFEWFEMSYLGDSNFASRKCPLSDFFPDAAKYPFASKIRFDSWAGYCALINHREGFADGSFHPGFKKFAFEVTERWLKPRVIDGVPFKGVDGIRLDVYGDVATSFWVQFREKVKSIRPDALIVAEEWYDGFHILKGDESDVLMNYTVRTLVESWFLNVDPVQKFRASWAKAFVDYRMNNHREHVKYGLWSMLSSHDTDRVLSKTILQNRLLSVRPQDGLSWDNSGLNKPDVGAPYSNDKPGVLEREFFKSMVAFQMAYVGAPLIYYGDEVGMWGADDPTDRKTMVWDDLAQGRQFETQCVTAPGFWCRENPEMRFSVEQDKDLLATYQRLIAARAAHPALRRGRLVASLELKVNGRSIVAGAPESDQHFVWGFERSYGSSDLAYFVSNQNLNLESQQIVLKSRFTPGTQVFEVITGKTLAVDASGQVHFTLGRDRAALFVPLP